jgi:hypothetical protein
MKTARDGLGNRATLELTCTRCSDPFVKSGGAHSQHGSCPGADPIERGKDEEHLTKVRG